MRAAPHRRELIIAGELTGATSLRVRARPVRSDALARISSRVTARVSRSSRETVSRQSRRNQFSIGDRVRYGSIESGFLWKNSPSRVPPGAERTRESSSPRFLAIAIPRARGSAEVAEIGAPNRLDRHPEETGTRGGWKNSAYLHARSTRMRPAERPLRKEENTAKRRENRASRSYLLSRFLSFAFRSPLSIHLSVSPLPPVFARPNVPLRLSSSGRTADR